MGRVLIIGAGGVGTVVAHKVAQNADEIGRASCRERVSSPV